MPPDPAAPPRLSLRFLFGRDVFVSYSRQDAASYGVALATALSARGLSAVLDQWVSLPGQAIPKRVIRDLRRASLLVVVGTARAAQSGSVLEEVRTFKALQRPMVAIDVDEGLAAGTELFAELEGLKLEAESGEALRAGQPSEGVLQRIARSLAYTRQSTRVQRAAGAAILLIVLALSATVATSVRVGNLQEQAQALDDKNAKLGEENKAAEDKLRSIGQDLEALEKTRRRLQEEKQVAESEAAAAKEATELANVEKERAESARAAAVVRAASASEAAALQTRVARAQEQMLQSPGELSSTLLESLESAQRLRELKASTLAADEVVRSALDVLPSRLGEHKSELEWGVLGPGGRYFARHQSGLEVFEVATGERVVNEPEGTMPAFRPARADELVYLDAGKISIVDLRTRARRAPLMAAGARRLRYSSDGAWLLAFEAGAVAIWDATRWAPAGRVSLSDVPTDAARSTDGTLLIVGNGWLRSWRQDASGTWRPRGRQQLPGGTAALELCEAGPFGAVVIPFGTMKPALWSIRSDPLGMLDTMPMRYTGHSVARQEGSLLFATDAAVTLDCATGKLSSSAERAVGYSGAVTLSTDGRLVAANDVKERRTYTEVFERGTQRRVAVLPHDFEAGDLVDVWLSESRFVTQYRDRRNIFWASPQMQGNAQLNVSAWVDGLAFDPTGESLWVTSTSTRDIVRYRLPRLGAAPPPDDLPSPGGERRAAKYAGVSSSYASFRGALGVFYAGPHFSVIDLTGHEPATEVALAANAVALHANGGALLARTPAGVHRVGLPDGRPELVAPVGGGHRLAADGRLQRFAVDDGLAIRVVQTATRDMISEYELELSPRDLQMSADGRWLAASGQCKYGNPAVCLRVWEVGAQRPLIDSKFAGNLGTCAPVIDPKSRWLAYAAGDGPVRVWDLRAPAAAPIVLSSSAEGTALAFHPELAFSQGGEWLAYSEPGGAVVVAQVGLWAPAQRFRHSGTVSVLTFSPDGRRLAVGTQKGEVRVWMLTFEDLWREACARLSTHLSPKDARFFRVCRSRAPRP